MKGPTCQGFLGLVYKVRTTEYFVFLFSTKQVELQYIYTSVILWHSVAFYELRWTGADIETLL